MIQHPGTTSWAFFTKQEALASMAPLSGKGYNSTYLKPQYTILERPPQKIDLPLRYINDDFSYVANIVSDKLNKNTEYNKNYLKAQPGIYMSDQFLHHGQKKKHLKNWAQEFQTWQKKKHQPKHWRTGLNI